MKTGLDMEDVSVKRYRKRKQYMAGAMEWASYQVVGKKLNSPLGYALLIGCTLASTYLIYKLGFPLGFILPAALFGIAFGAVLLFNIRLTFFLAIFISFFIFYVKRLVSDELPIGTLIEVLLAVAFVGFLIEKAKNRNRSWKFAKHPITYIHLIYFVFLLIQAFNLEMHSIDGWVFTIRKFAGFMVAYFITLYLFQDLKFFKQFVVVWLGLAFLVALYSFYQELFGLPAFEEAWLRQDITRFRLTFIGGRFRKFSFLSDPTSFGILMAMTGLFCFVLAAGPFKMSKKLVFLALSMVMFTAMSFSGTRTAYAMVPVGIVAFVLLTITNKNTLVLFAVFVIGAAVLMYGPIYGNKTVNRLRSTFQPTEDASYQVRENNRAYIRPYLYAHPFGGGLGTTGVAGRKYNPDHFLAGFPPDSGYMRVVLETGWIGLALTLVLFFIVLQSGAANFYNRKDKKIKYYYAALTVSIYSIAIAEYAQSAVGQLPGALILYPMLALMAGLKNYDKKEELIEQN